MARVFWGCILAGLGLVVAMGWLPGSSGWSTGPRVGLAVMLLSLGATLLAAAAVPWVLRRTTRPEDYEGNCPVGRVCTCGAFNMKPRRACRACGSELADS